MQTFKRVEVSRQTLSSRSQIFEDKQGEAASNKWCVDLPLPPAISRALARNTLPNSPSPNIFSITSRFLGNSHFGSIGWGQREAGEKWCPQSRPFKAKFGRGSKPTHPRFGCHPISQSNRLLACYRWRGTAVVGVHRLLFGARPSTVSPINQKHLFNPQN